MSTMSTRQLKTLLDEMARQRVEAGETELALDLQSLAKVFDEQRHPKLDKLLEQIRLARGLNAASAERSRPA